MDSTKMDSMESCSGVYGALGKYLIGEEICYISQLLQEWPRPLYPRNPKVPLAVYHGTDTKPVIWTTSGY